MPAEVETMFYAGREVPWHGLGTQIDGAPTSADAIRLAGLDWNVIQEKLYTNANELITGFRANIRDTDRKVLGVVTDRYKVVQNSDAFAFTDELLGEGVLYETAGSLQEGKRTWMLARMPERYIIAGDEITPYLVVMNSHDGSSGIKVAMTPVRVVCQNTLNLALHTAKRTWASKHTENVLNRVHEAQETLQLANAYMGQLGKDIDKLTQIKLSDEIVLKYMQEFFPITEDMSDSQKRNNFRLLEDMKQRYWDAPDFTQVGKNAWRFVNAVSDFATHASPLRLTRNYNENLFIRTVEGNPLIDKAYRMALAAA